MKNKKLLLLIIVVIVIGLLGVSYAFFEYYGESANHRVKTGVVKLNFNEDTDTISLTNIFPETKEEARARTDNVITFTVSGVNTTTNKDIWYEIMLNEGVTLEGKTRFNHNDMVFDLVEINSDKTETLVVDAMSYNDFNERRIWVNTVDRETETEITKTYKLRMWLNENVKISDTNPNADYSTSVFKNSYASVRVSVYGDFLEKKLPVRLSKQIEDTLPLTDPNIDGTRYVYGQTEDNYLWYSGKLWRIVSINGDGSVKLVTQGNMTTLAWDTSSTNTDYSTSQVRSWLNNEFLPTLYDANNLLVDSTWDYTTYAEATATKVEATSFVQNERVGLLTIYDYYSSGASSGFLNNSYVWWTMSPATDGSGVWDVYSYGIEYVIVPTRGLGVRPSINMKSYIQIVGGSGTKSDPYVIEGDKTTGVSSELLNNRISGEYISFNNTLYRIVGIEEVNGQKLTKITMADYSVNKNTLTTSLSFGADNSQRIYSSTYGIGVYLEGWYQADSTSETYATTYIKDNYKAMIATSGDGVVWYTGPTSGTGYDYTLAKTGTPVSATIGMGYYGEMFSSQFGNGMDSSAEHWLMTIFSSSHVWYGRNYGDTYDCSPTASNGVRPSFYLKSGVKIASGSGMPHDPYEIEYESKIEPKTLVDTIIDSVGTSGLVAVATDGTLYTDETTQTLRDYRFSGSNDVVTNNYVNFDGDLWRIIGVMPTEKEDGTTENLIKIIKATPLTAEQIPTTYTYNNVVMTLKNSDTSNLAYWNYSNYFNQTNLNDWTKAAVQYFLNDETEGSSSYYNSIDPIYQAMIQKSVYHLGDGVSDTPLDSYTEEQSETKLDGNETIWTGNIGLMYPSDYGYAADSTYWTTVMLDYDGDACNYDWLYIGGNDQWTISPTTVNPSGAVGVYSTGNVYYHGVNRSPKVVSPVLYLKSEVKILGGTGLEEDAYRLG